LVHALSFGYTVDDAFISFRYAQNWVAGEGLVFNPGEGVEGYTNFLWTVLIGAGIAAGVDPVPFSKALGVAAGILLLWVLLGYGKRRFPRSLLVAILPLPLAANGAFALWCAAGLETSLFALLLFAGVAAATGGDRKSFLLASFFFVLASLTRPEGVLLFAVVAADRWMQRPPAYRGILPGLALFVAALAIFEVWRITTYGDLLPNTFYAKTGGGIHAAWRGLRYWAGYIGPFGGWTLVLPLFLFFLIPLRSWERTFLAALVAYAVYVVLVGGDGLPFYRFIVPAVPLLALLCLSVLARVFPEHDGGLSPLRYVAFSLLLALPLQSTFRGEALRFVQEDRARVELHWKVIGQWLGENASPGESIAVTTAGAIPYYSGLPTIDMLGITDRTIAKKEMPGMGEGIAGHEKHDMEYVLSRKPTYILHYTFLLPEPVFTTGQFRTPWNRGLEGLLSSERFDREYRGEHAKIGSMYFIYFQRKEDTP